MQTKKLYYENSYIKDFIAEVLSCEESDNKYKVILDKTAFFPEGGGQKPDLGSIGDAVVTDVQEVDGTVFHFLNKPLNIGEFYDCSIDWDIRFRRMQEHSGEHIVSGIVHGIYGYENVGFHMDEDYVTVDFNGELNREQLDDIEERANKAVYADYDIKCWFPDEKELNFLNYRSKLELTENVRLVEIENTDLCACCAPHLKRTGEVGIIKILDFMRHRGGVRIVIKSGLDALRDYRKKYKSVYDVSGLLSAKQDEIASSVERVQGELDCVKRDFYNFKIGVAQNDKENITIKGECAYFISSCYDTDMMRELANYSMLNHKLCLVFSGTDGEGYSYIIGSNELDMKKVASLINTSLNGRGGGRGTMIQGKISADKSKIIDFIENLDVGAI